MINLGCFILDDSYQILNNELFDLIDLLGMIGFTRFLLYYQFYSGYHSVLTTQYIVPRRILFDLMPFFCKILPKKEILLFDIVIELC